MFAGHGEFQRYHSGDCIFNIGALQKLRRAL